MPDSPQLVPTSQLAATNKTHFPNESPAYRDARNKLLAEEIELRRHLERVAAQRRALPPGGEIAEDFEVASKSGARRISQLFGDKTTLLVYSMMFGPQRKAPCPSCTSFLRSWNGTVINLRERVAIAVTARSPIERLLEYQNNFALNNLRFFSDGSGNYTRTYVSPDDGDVPGFSVFSKRDGKVRHFYSGEMGPGMSDPGQDPRGAPELDPLWTMFDWTPEGRDPKWYPKLNYNP